MHLLAKPLPPRFICSKPLAFTALSDVIEILPKLKRSLKHNGRMILSGVLRTQERELRRTLGPQKIDIVKVRRRGKWLAMLAKL